MLSKIFDHPILSWLLICFCLTSCIPLDVTPTKLDINQMKAYVRPTKPTSQNPNRDLDLTDPKQLHFLHKMTCFSADDLAQIENRLNQCKNNQTEN